MANRKEWEMAFMLSASMSGSYASTFTKAQSQIAAFQKEIDILNKTNADIASYQKQQQAVENTRSKLEMLKQQYANIQQEMEETGNKSSDMKNKLLDKEAAINKTSQALKEQTDKLTAMGAALEDAGFDVQDLTAEAKRLSYGIDDLKNRQEEAADAANDFGESATAAFQAASDMLIASGIKEGLEELYEVYAKCVEVSAGFEASMSQVAATMGLSSDEVQDLAEFAKEMGASTSFSAVQASEGLNILAMAGLNASEQMSALPTVLDLAAAGAMDMATAAGFVTGAVKGFGDEMDNAGYYADLMAKGATMANTNVTQLGEALSMTAATANAYGQTAGSTTLALLRLAEQNVVGSEASTKLARAMADLYTPTEEASGALEDLGVSMYDESGNARDFNDVIDELNGELQSYTTEQQNALKNTIFTTNGLKAFNEMTVSSAKKVESFYTGLLTSSGSATQQAKTQLDNYNGALTIMNSALEGTEISIGEIFLPGMTKVVQIGTEALTEINEFVKANPEAVKAVTVFTGVVGAGTVALVSYAAAAKVVKALNLASLFTGPAGMVLGGVAAVAALAAGVAALAEATKVELGEEYELTAASRAQYKQLQELNEEYERVCALYGETSYEAQNLQWQIDDLNEEYENGKQTLNEYQAAHDSLMDSYSQMVDSFDSTNGSIDIETESTIALIEKLRELTSTSDGAAQNQDAIRIIIDKLNESLPELATNYDKLVNGGDEYIDTLRSVAEEQGKQKKIQADYEAYLERLGKVDALKNDLDAAIANKKLAQAEYDAAYAAWEASMKLYQYDAWGMAFGANDENAALESARAQLEEYTASMDEAQKAYDENSTAIASLEGSFRSCHQEMTEGEDDVSSSVENVTEKVQALATMYNEAYEAAYQSVQGQYALWSEAADVVATSVGTINTNLADQIAYWQQYNSNLSSLRDRASDIEGLDEVISSFADGSADSVNAIAGMASATDTELADMVENWTELQSEQDEVAANIAELKTDFTDEMAELTSQLQSDIEAMNFGEDAAQSGKNTIQGFIDGALEMVPRVQEAYAAIAQAALDAIDDKLEINSPSKVMAERADYTWAGWINETYAMQEEVRRAMADTVGYGAQSVNAQVTTNTGGPVSVAVTFQIDGRQDGVADDLREYGDEFAERVLNVVQQAQDDANRRSYR